MSVCTVAAKWVQTSRAATDARAQMVWQKMRRKPLSAWVSHREGVPSLPASRGWAETSEAMCYRLEQRLHLSSHIYTSIHGGTLTVWSDRIDPSFLPSFLRSWKVSEKARLCFQAQVGSVALTKGTHWTINNDINVWQIKWLVNNLLTAVASRAFVRYRSASCSWLLCGRAGAAASSPDEWGQPVTNFLLPFKVGLAITPESKAHQVMETIQI